MTSSLPKDVKNIIIEYAKPRYELFLNSKIRGEIEYSHAMTECWYTICIIEVNDIDNKAIITLGVPNIDDPDDTNNYATYFCVGYNKVNYWSLVGYDYRGGDPSTDLLEKTKQGYTWKTIYNPGNYSVSWDGIISQ